MGYQGYSSHVIFFICAVLTLVPSVTAHFKLLNPRPYNPNWRTTSCVEEECTNACPSIWNNGMANSIKDPASVFSRGEKFTLKWAKNNHRGGLLMVSIVPAHVMMSRMWQKKLAVYYGCWEQGKFKCAPGEECGSDTAREGFSRPDFQIPAIYPDGMYVLSVVWYGGLHYSRLRGQFADYYSCSFIEISGGPLEYSYQPFWDAGDTGKYNHDGMCESATSWLGMCGAEGCTKDKSFWTMDKHFRNGAKPPMLTKTDIIEAIDDGKDDMWKLEQKGEEAGMCSGGVCCPKTCGKCGGANCNSRPGGGENCCTNPILQSGKMCDTNMPPCVVRE